MIAGSFVPSLLYKWPHLFYWGSDGEKQRVQFARVLAQIWEQPQDGCRYLFLDEPLASLDIKYQQEFLQIAKFIAVGFNQRIIKY